MIFEKIKNRNGMSENEGIFFKTAPESLQIALDISRF